MERNEEHSQIIKDSVTQDKDDTRAFRRSSNPEVNQKLEEQAAEISRMSAAFLIKYQPRFHEIKQLCEKHQTLSDSSQTLSRQCDKIISLFSILCDMRSGRPMPLDGKTTLGRLRSKAANYKDYMTHTYVVEANIDLIRHDAIDVLMGFLSFLKSTYDPAYPLPFYQAVRKDMASDFDTFLEEMNTDRQAIIDKAEAMIQLAAQSTPKRRR